MPKSRKPEKLDYCSFCGEHKNEVPLLISSPLAAAAICTACSLTMVHQNVSWASGVFKAVQADHERMQESKIKIAGGVDATHVAIGKVMDGSEPT